MQGDTSTRCKATKQDGSPCSGHPLKGGAYCWFHEPTAAGERAQGRRLGGSARSNRNRARKALPAELMSMEEVQSYLGVTLRGVLHGKIEPGVGTAVATIARAMATVGGAADFEEQLAEMRRELASLSEQMSA